jgi:hypothetical protein
VLIEGDPALVPAIAAALLSRGLGPATDDGCPVTRVLVQRRDPHIAVLLRDEIRSTERQVIDRETAVSLIESWVRSDLSAPLLLGSIAALPPSSMSQSPDSPPSTTWDARGTVSLHGLFAMDVAGRPWMGAGLRGCARVFRLCIGGAWQTLGQLTLSGEDGRRVVTELFAIVALPARVGRAWLWPSLGLGVSWLHVSTRLLLRDGEGDPIELEPEDTIAVNASTVAAGVLRARRLSQATLGNIRQNLWFAFLYNALGVPIAGGALYPLLGVLPGPMLASAAMSLSSLCVISNALRLRSVRLTEDTP